MFSNQAKLTGLRWGSLGLLSTWHRFRLPLACCSSLGEQKSAEDPVAMVLTECPVAMAMVGQEESDGLGISLDTDLLLGEGGGLIHHY